MKKIINETNTVVNEMCEGIIKAYPDNLVLNSRYKIIKRKNKNGNKVNIISGGGSGHEPSHGGMVGYGMLDAAVCGDVFASPSSIQVYNAILDCKTKKGVLLIIKNYSGDRLNFDTAAEMAIEDDGILVEKVYVNDDIAVEDSLYTEGRRGVAGTVFVHKIAGAYAELGKPLTEVKKMAEKVIQSVRSLGFGLTSCTVPAKGSPTFKLDENEMEYGVGIHGEPGIERKEILNSKALAADMVERITADLNLDRDDEVALLINGLGGTPLMELFLFNNDVQRVLEEKGIRIFKTFVGNYMTSIDMAGASVSLLKLDSELKELLLHKSEAPGFIV